MSKAIQTKTDKEIIEDIAVEMRYAFDALDGNPEAQKALQTAYEMTQLLARSNRDLHALFKGAQAAIAEALAQRDMAITEVDYLKVDMKLLQKAGLQKALKAIAGRVAVDFKIPVTDVERVLAVLVGERATFEETLLETFAAVMQQLADALYREQVIDAAED